MRSCVLWVCGLHDGRTDGRTERNYSARTTSHANEYWCASPVRFARGQYISIINTSGHRIARLDTTKEKIRSRFTWYSIILHQRTRGRSNSPRSVLTFYIFLSMTNLLLNNHLLNNSFRSISFYNRARRVRKRTEIQFAKAVLSVSPFDKFFFTILMRSAIVPLDNVSSWKDGYRGSMLNQRKCAVSAILAFYRLPLSSTSVLFVLSPQLTFLERCLPVVKRLNEKKRLLRAFLELLQEFCRYFSLKRLSRFFRLFFFLKKVYTKFHFAMKL